jgi:LysM repeat protein
MSIVTSNLFGQLKSNNIKTINGKKYYLHKVEKKQTLYSISKLYTVDLEAIYNLNPELKSGVKAEQEIIIPIADKKLNNIKSENGNLTPEAIDTLKFITHKADKSETLFSICKKFNISQEEIIELNPLLRNGLKERQLLILGKKNKTSDNKKNSLILKTSKINITDSVTINKIIKTKKTDYKIALVLPFKLDQTLNIDIENLAKSNSNFPLSSELAIDFYLGFKKAINYLVTDKFKINIELFDISDNDSLILNELEKNTSFKELDFIFGPFFAGGFKSISKKAKEFYIPIISPTTQQNKILHDNIYTSKTNPSQYSLIESLADYCIDSLKNINANILLATISDKDKKESDFVNAFKIRYNEKLNLLGKTKDSLHLVKGITGIKKSYLSKKNNIIVFFSNKKIFVSDFINQIALLSNDKNIILCGLQSTTFFDNLDQEYLNQLGYTFPFQYDLSTINNKIDTEIIASYIDEQGTFPSENYFIGYDIATYYLKHLRDDGPEFIHQLDKLPSVSNYIRFNFFRPDSTTGFDNRGSYIFKYNNYELIKTGWK